MTWVQPGPGGGGDAPGGALAGGGAPGDLGALPDELLRVVLGRAARGAGAPGALLGAERACRFLRAALRAPEVLRELPAAGVAQIFGACAAVEVYSMTHDSKGDFKGGKGFKGMCWGCGEAGHREFECKGKGSNNLDAATGNAEDQPQDAQPSPEQPAED